MAISRKLVKLMMMTTSTHDQEALTALRMANQMLSAMGLNWEELLSAAPKKAERKAKAKPRPRPKSEPPKPEPRPEPPKPERRQRHTSRYRYSSHDADRMEIEQLFEELAAHRNDLGRDRAVLVSIWKFWHGHGHMSEAQHRILVLAVENAKRHARARAA